MDNLNQDSNRPINSRRKKRSQIQVFKEAYLPAIIAGTAALLILIFVIGSISRAVERNKIERLESIAASESLAAEQARLDEDAIRIADEAQLLAMQYDYQGAIDLINSFDGIVANYPALSDALSSYEQLQSELVAWEDISQIPNLSFQLLIADPERAFSDETYGVSYNRNFVTTQEFSSIIQQLYANDYVLVTTKDFITTEQAADGATVYTAKPLYLPSGKKPIMLTQTQVNYNTYMIDGDGDKLPDKDGAGFASRLMLDAAGAFTCEMVTAEGETVTGAYDLVPILEDFLKTNPDFSYHGSRAVLALTGYDGLFGYRTSETAKEHFGEAAVQQAIDEVKILISALKENGYELASYTYNNAEYGNMSATQMQSDLTHWHEQVAPILGNVRILAFAKNSDISDQTPYAGTKFNLLYNAGFRIFLGFCEDGKPWCTVDNQHVRMGRILVTGSNLANHADWFSALFNTNSVLDPARG